MYLNDYNIRHLLAIFFAVGISQEITTLLGMELPIISLIYVIGFLLIIFNFVRLKKYIWPPGLGLVGLFSLTYLIFLLIGYGSNFFRSLSSIVSILVWIKCTSYLNNNDDDEDQYYEIIENNEEKE